MARDRAFRRHKDEVQKDRAKTFLKVLHRYDETWPIDDKRVGKRAATRHPCSCHMCGHRREVEGPPTREKRWTGVDI